MMLVEIGDHVCYTPFKGTDEEDGQHSVKVLEHRDGKSLVTDIFGNEFELSHNRIESVNTRSQEEREYFDAHVGRWTTK